MGADSKFKYHKTLLRRNEQKEFYTSKDESKQWYIDAFDLINDEGLMKIEYEKIADKLPTDNSNYSIIAIIFFRNIPWKNLDPNTLRMNTLSSVGEILIREPHYKDMIDVSIMNYGTYHTFQLYIRVLTEFAEQEPIFRKFFDINENYFIKSGPNGNKRLDVFVNLLNTKHEIEIRQIQDDSIIKKLYAEVLNKTYKSLFLEAYLQPQQKTKYFEISTLNKTPLIKQLDGIINAFCNDAYGFNIDVEGFKEIIEEYATFKLKKSNERNNKIVFSGFSNYTFYKKYAEYTKMCAKHINDDDATSMDRIAQIVHVGPININKFYEKNFFNNKGYEHDCEIVKEYNDVLYKDIKSLEKRNEYINSIKNRKYLEDFVKYMENVDYFGYMKTDGKNGQNVTLLDAVQRIPKFSADMFIYCATEMKGLKPNIRKRLQYFAVTKVYEKCNNRDIERINSCTLGIHGYVIDEELNSEIINFMKINEYPLYFNIYRDIARRLIDKEGVLHKEKFELCKRFT